MPSMVVHMVKGRSRDEKRMLLDALHQGLVDGFQIPEDDRCQRVVEFDPDDFIIPDGKSSRFIQVEITCFAGRSLDAKRALYKSIGDNVEAAGENRMEMMIVLHEVPMENWGLRGGLPASEVDLGFKVDV